MSEENSSNNPAGPRLTTLREAPADLHAKVRRTMRSSTVEGCVTTVFMTCTTGSFLTGFLLYLGAGPLALALAAAIPNLVQFVNPVAAWLTSRLGKRRLFIILNCIPGRMVWILPALLPLWVKDLDLQLTVLMGVIFLSGFFQTAAGPAWVSMIADVVPADVRGRYFGWRSSLCGIVGMVSALLGGWFLDHISAPAGFQIMYILAVLFAMAGIFLYRFYYDPPVNRVALSFGETLRTPFRDGNFRRFLAFSVYWQGSVMVAAPFVIPYFFKHLHMNYTQVAIWSAIASMASLWLSPLWGKIADVAGHKSVLSITTILAGTVHPACWMLATPGNLTFIWIGGLMEAVAWGGINPAMFNMVISTAPRNQRMAFVAVLGLLNGAVGFVMGLLSGPLMNLFLLGEFTVFGFHWTGYHSLFLLSGLMRSQAWRLLQRVHEPRSIPARDVIRGLRMWTLSHLPWRSDSSEMTT